MRTGAQVQHALREELAILLGKSSPLRIAKQSPLTVLLIIGVNGSGKTTSIAKMAHRLTQEGRKVIMAEPIRSEQEQSSSCRNGEDVLMYQSSARIPAPSGSGGLRCLQAAQSRGCDALLVDTAGRLHTKYNLMEELKKINRVIQKFVPDGPHELLIVIDATTGQNALQKTSICC